MNNISENAFIYSSESGKTENTKKEKENNNHGGIASIGKQALKEIPVQGLAIDAPSDVKSKKWKIEQQIPEHSDIFRKSIALTESSRSEPLQHYNLKSTSICDVYITEDVVFKPGEEAALKAKICYGLMRLIGIERAVVPSKQGKATVVSREDKKLNGSDVSYTVVQLSPSKGYLIPNEEIRQEMKGIQITEKKQGKEVICQIKGEQYTLVPTRDGYKLEERLNALDRLLGEEYTFIAVKDKEGNAYLAEEGQLFSGQNVADGEEVEFNGQMYEASLTKKEEGNFVQLIHKESGESFEFQEMFSEEDEDVSLWVKTDAYFPFDKEAVEENENLFPYEGKEYEAVESGGTYHFNRASGDPFLEENREERFAIVTATESAASDKSSKRSVKKLVKTLVPIDSVSKEDLEEASPLFMQQGKAYVERNDQKYEIVEGQEGIKVIGKDIKGMVQAKIMHIFTGKKSQKDPVLDVRTPSDARKAFYARIPMKLFIEPFFATLLLRPQDGKILTLDETNVLFSALPNEDGVVDPNLSSCPLMPILIDLDEALPTNNESLTMEKDAGGEITHEGTKQVNPVRFGLMGFPHARRPLSIDEKQRVLELIETTIRESREPQQYLSTFTKKEKILHKENLEAFVQVVDAMKTFYEAHQDLSVDWCLQDLCFAVLPAYKRDWEKIGDRDDPEQKAAMIGYSSMEEIEWRWAVADKTKESIKQAQKGKEAVEKKKT